MPDLELRGCRTTPLMSHLKALGVFRHVAEHDRAARLWWDPTGFARLRSRFDDVGLVNFFLDDYAPSPITSPWNGSSGYYPGDNTTAIEKIERSAAIRLAPLRDAIASARTLLGPTPEKPGDDKTTLLEHWRGKCPERALEWLDAATVLTESGPSMNPLLGTGGNDGHFEFSNNFLARLAECLPPLIGESSVEGSRRRLEASLFGKETPLCKATVGMFDPGGAGLPNSSSSPSEDSLLNPWDFVLLLEGVLLFGGGVARRLSADRATFPFTVREPSRLGHSLRLDADAKVRGETWLPVWHRPASLASLRRLHSEGRAQDGRQYARSGNELFRAAADVGMDRGIASFERIVYAERFGRNYIAVTAGTVATRPVQAVHLLRLADQWLDRVRRVDSGEVRRRVAEIDRSAADLVVGPDEHRALERWLLALARAELAVARRPASRMTSTSTHISPLGGLDASLVRSLEDSVEHRLARTLAAVGRTPEAMGLRSLVEPVTPTHGGRFVWSNDRPASGGLRKPVDLLLAFAASARTADLPDTRRVRLTDVAAFLRGETDDRRIVELAYAFTFCRPCDQRVGGERTRLAGTDRLYAACRLALDDHPSDDGERASGYDGTEVTSLLAAGSADAAARVVARRLRARDLTPMRALASVERLPDSARRIAAALAFPLHSEDRRYLEAAVLVSDHARSSPEGATA